MTVTDVFQDYPHPDDHTDYTIDLHLVETVLIYIFLSYRMLSKIRLKVLVLVKRRNTGWTMQRRTTA